MFSRVVNRHHRFKGINGAVKINGEGRTLLNTAVELVDKQRVAGAPTSLARGGGYLPTVAKADNATDALYYEPDSKSNFIEFVAIFKYIVFSCGTIDKAK